MANMEDEDPYKIHVQDSSYSLIFSAPVNVSWATSMYDEEWKNVGSGRALLVQETVDKSFSIQILDPGKNEILLRHALKDALIYMSKGPKFQYFVKGSRLVGLEFRDEWDAEHFYKAVHQKMAVIAKTRPDPDSITVNNDLPPIPRPVSTSSFNAESSTSREDKRNVKEKEKPSKKEKKKKKKDKKDKLKKICKEDISAPQNPRAYVQVNVELDTQGKFREDPKELHLYEELAIFKQFFQSPDHDYSCYVQRPGQSSNAKFANQNETDPDYESSSSSSGHYDEVLFESETPTYQNIPPALEKPRIHKPLPPIPEPVEVDQLEEIGYKTVKNFERPSIPSKTTPLETFYENYQPGKDTILKTVETQQVLAEGDTVGSSEGTPLTESVPPVLPPKPAFFRKNHDMVSKFEADTEPTTSNPPSSNCSSEGTKEKPELPPRPGVPNKVLVVKTSHRTSNENADRSVRTRNLNSDVIRLSLDDSTPTKPNESSDKVEYNVPKSLTEVRQVMFKVNGVQEELSKLGQNADSEQIRSLERILHTYILELNDVDDEGRRNVKEEQKTVSNAIRNILAELQKM